MFRVIEFFVFILGKLHTNLFIKFINVLENSPVMGPTQPPIHCVPAAFYFGG
jgi:hypothetical protein